MKRRQWRYKKCGCEVDPDGSVDRCYWHHMFATSAWRTAL